jgi:hypothetical protein
VKGRKTGVRTNNQIRCQAEDPAASAVAIVIVAEDPEILRQRYIEVHGTAYATRAVTLSIKRIVDSERAEQPRDF